MWNKYNLYESIQIEPILKYLDHKICCIERQEAVKQVFRYHLFSHENKESLFI